MQQPSETEPSPPPRELRGRYLLGKRLGGGAQADTYEGVDRKQGRPVVVKRFRIRGAPSWKDVELAEREATVLAALDHPDLPRYVEHFEEDGCLFLVTEKIQGETLATLQARHGQLAERDVLEFLEFAARILEYLHTRAPPIIHRDIKPANVIRRADGSFALVDFGAVLNRVRPEGGSTVVGTFGFMAPEQFQGRAVPATDVYGVGATAITLLTGRPPEDLPHKGLQIDVAAALLRDTRDPFVVALSALLEIDPDRRPRDLRPIVDSLRRGARGERPSRTDEAGATESTAGEWTARELPGVPPAAFLVLRIGLILAQLAVTIALQVLIPLVLTILSLFATPRLRDTAQAVRVAGDRARRALRKAERAARASRRRERGHRRVRSDRIRVASAQPEHGEKPEEEVAAEPPVRARRRR